jgi:hypothetical protein
MSATTAFSFDPGWWSIWLGVAKSHASVLAHAIDAIGVIEVTLLF